MVRQIQALGAELNLSDGGLLKLAREISGDGAMISWQHMKRSDLEALLGFLERISRGSRVREMALTA